MRTKAGYVYIFRAKGEQLYKVGRTNRTPLERMRDLSSGCPYDLELVAEFATVNADAAEKYAHSYLAKWLKRKEWFEMSSSTMKASILHFQGLHDLALGSGNYEVVDGKYIVLKCSVGDDDIALTTVKCPFCGKEHYHGTGGTDFRKRLWYVEGIPTVGHRVAHCDRKPIEIQLPNGCRLSNADGYYLRPVL